MEEERWEGSAAVDIQYHRVREVGNIVKPLILQNWSPEKLKDLYTDRARIRT